MSELHGYQHQIDAVKAAIIEQKVPTAYPKGLAILCVLNCNYEAGDALAGFFLDKAMASDPAFLDDLEKELGIKPNCRGRLEISAIRDEYAKNYQIFRALFAAGIDGDIITHMKEDR